MITLKNNLTNTHALLQGFSTFWYSRTPNSKLNSFRIPPKQHLIPFVYLLWAHFAMISISTYPLQTPCVPLGVRVPQVENRCYRTTFPYAEHKSHRLNRFIKYFPILRCRFSTEDQMRFRRVFCLLIARHFYCFENFILSFV
jgi:hypothetical protein